jgi:hypothetical protein
MLKSLEIRRVENQIREDEEMLAHMVHQTEAVHIDAFSRIVALKSEGNLGWKQALGGDAIQEELFQLLLHRQFIGFLAESVRKNRSKLLRLQGHGAMVLEQYNTLIEKGTAKTEMETLLCHFTKELWPLLEAFERGDAM